MNDTEDKQAVEEDSPRLAQLIEESWALSYLLARTLASSPRGELSHDALDALCQLAYQVFQKLDTAKEVGKHVLR
jgi:hypothetical protein